MSEQTLAPCPYCGSAPTTSPWVQTFTPDGFRVKGMTQVAIRCSNPDCRMPKTVRPDLTSAVEAWNELCRSLVQTEWECRIEYSQQAVEIKRVKAATLTTACVKALGELHGGFFDRVPVAITVRLKEDANG